MKRTTVSPLQLSMLMHFHKVKFIKWNDLPELNMKTFWSLIHRKWVSEKSEGIGISELGEQMWTTFRYGNDDFWRLHNTGKLSPSVLREFKRGTRLYLVHSKAA